MPTLDEIARYAGVSRTTVSYVLNNRRRPDGSISEETRGRVLEAAAALGYQLNELARSVVAGKAAIIALLTGDDELETKGHIISGVLRGAAENDYLVKLLALPGYTVGEDAVRSCVKWRVSGVLVLNVDQKSLDERQPQFALHGIPLVMADNAPERPWAPRVVSDESQGVGLVVDHLLEIGHRRIAFLGGPQSNSLARWREECFRLAMQTRDIPLSEDSIARGTWFDVAMTVAPARQLLSGTVTRPTAIICASDGMAMVVQKEARAVGLRVPEDLSVTGYGDTTMCLFGDPPLTSLRQPFREIGRTAVRNLIELSRSTGTLGAEVPFDTLLPSELIVRGSTAPPGS